MILITKIDRLIEINSTRLLIEIEVHLEDEAPLRRLGLCIVTSNDEPYLTNLRKEKAMIDEVKGILNL